jgi:hypothetical protein
MKALQRLLAVLFTAFAVVVTVQFVFSSFYQDAVDIGQVWNYVNYLMVLGVLAGLIVHYLRKHALCRPAESLNREYLEVNIAFYVSVVLVLCFFWNWFDDLTVGVDAQDMTHLLMWTFVNPLVVVISGHTGFHLWREASRQRTCEQVGKTDQAPAVKPAGVLSRLAANRTGFEVDEAQTARDRCCPVEALGLELGRRFSLWIIKDPISRSTVSGRSSETTLSVPFSRSTLPRAAPRFRKNWAPWSVYATCPSTWTVGKSSL